MTAPEFEALYPQMEPRLRQYARGRLRAHHLPLHHAEDIVQSAMLAAWKILPDLLWPVAFLHRTALHLVYNLARKEWRLRSLDEATEAALCSPAAALDALAAALPGDLDCLAGGAWLPGADPVALARAFLDRQAPREREIGYWRLRFTATNREEMRRRWQCSPTTLARQWQRVRSGLAAILESARER